MKTHKLSKIFMTPPSISIHLFLALRTTLPTCRTQSLHSRYSKLRGIRLSKIWEWCPPQEAFRALSRRHNINRITCPIPRFRVPISILWGIEIYLGQVQQSHNGQGRPYQEAQKLKGPTSWHKWVAGCRKAMKVHQWLRAKERRPW